MVPFKAFVNTAYYLIHCLLHEVTMYTAQLFVNIMGVLTLQLISHPMTEWHSKHGKCVATALAVLAVIC